MIRKMQKNRRGVTLVEIMISVGIFTILTIMVITAMILYARSLQALHAQSKLQNNLTMLLQKLNFEMDEVVRISLNQDGDRLRFVYPQGNLRKELVYQDDDNNPATIGDNRLVLVEFLDGNQVRSTTLISGISPVGEDPVFNQISQPGRDVWELYFRAGDRDNPPSPENERVTGPGYQSHIARFALTPRNALTGS
ncbi:MAG: prepilin-type N-terminal cleavage/methylation domain-containing protein [Candidatus Sumerlaeia bacterium]|nr:prepilin-type N-terminal cleavage/methylation domain-containing protein [Candidatus Sumerlaeia bacterium]